MTAIARKLLDTNDVLQIVGCGKTCLSEMIRDGQFPAPVKIGSSNRWKESIVHKWYDDLTPTIPSSEDDIDRRVIE